MQRRDFLKSLAVAFGLSEALPAIADASEFDEDLGFTRDWEPIESPAPFIKIDGASVQAIDFTLTVINLGIKSVLGPSPMFPEPNREEISIAVLDQLDPSVKVGLHDVEFCFGKHQLNSLAGKIEMIYVCDDTWSSNGEDRTVYCYSFAITDLKVGVGRA